MLLWCILQVQEGEQAPYRVYRRTSSLGSLYILQVPLLSLAYGWAPLTHFCAFFNTLSCDFISLLISIFSSHVGAKLGHFLRNSLNRSTCASRWSSHLETLDRVAPDSKRLVCIVLGFVGDQDLTRAEQKATIIVMRLGPSIVSILKQVQCHTSSFEKGGKMFCH